VHTFGEAPKKKLVTHLDNMLMTTHEINWKQLSKSKSLPYNNKHKDKWKCNKKM
jgi:hypothetical protein